MLHWSMSDQNSTCRGTSYQNMEAQISSHSGCYYTAPLHSKQMFVEPLTVSLCLSVLHVTTAFTLHCWVTFHRHIMSLSVFLSQQSSKSSFLTVKVRTGVLFMSNTRLWFIFSFVRLLAAVPASCCRGQIILIRASWGDNSGFLHQYVASVGNTASLSRVTPLCVAFLSNLGFDSYCRCYCSLL